MHFSHLLYNLLAFALAPIVLPAVWCHQSRDPERKAALMQRFGYPPAATRATPPKRPLIWIHAVSVGEVKAAEIVLRALEAFALKGSILLTTTTLAGHRYARQHLARRATVRYAPLDLWWTTRRFLATYRPDLLVCMETEIWPNWIVGIHRAGKRTVFINGRISSRSIRSYRRIRPLLKSAFRHVDAFSMISRQDADRIVQLGACARRVHVNGNVKMDIRDGEMKREVAVRLRQRFGVGQDTPVFVAGSIRGAETGIVLSAYRQLALGIPGLVCVVAPRHIEKASQIAAAARKMGIAWQYRTQMEAAEQGRRAPLVILDTIGELRDLYSIATVVFCGASLVPLGGQNVLEAAAWAKPVLFGPFMDDFQAARTLLETSGGGICVRSGDQLARQAQYLLTHPADARRRGRAARNALMANRGAARRHARVIIDLLSNG